jgi:UDP-glucose 4-epimerase
VDNLRTGRLEYLQAAHHSPRFRFVRGDITDEPFLAGLFERERFRGVLHLAALVSVAESIREPALNFHLNLAATDVVARLCLRYGCRRMVFASSAAVYGDATCLPIVESLQPQPLSPYGAAKLASEDLLLGYHASYGLETVCLRYFNVYGPGQDPRSPYSEVLSIFSRRFRGGLPVTVYGNGEQTRDFVSVHDVATANMQALTADQALSGVYNLCTGRGASLKQVLAVYFSAYPQAPAVLYAERRPGDILHSVGDPHRALEALGIEARTELASGLRELIDWEGEA